MRGKVYASILLGMLFFVVSCHQEEGPLHQSGNTKFDLLLTTTGLQSRAIDGQGNYAFARAEELEINKCFVAFFDKKSKKRLYFKEVYKDAPNPDDRLVVESKTDDAGNPASPTYKVPGIGVKPGDVYIVVIANSARTDLATFDTYGKLTASTVVEQTQLSSTFDPRNLVKVGEVEYTIQPGPNVVEVALTQLAARVDFTLKVTIADEYIKDSVDYFLTDDMLRTLRNASSGVNPSGKQKVGTLFGKDIYAWSCGAEPGGGEHDIWYGDAGNRKNYRNTAVKKVHLDKACFDKVQMYYAYGLAIEKITIKNIQTKTMLMLPPLDPNYLFSTNPYREDFLTPPWQQQDVNPVATAEKKITFYTYEKDFYFDQEEVDAGAIKIEVEGTLIRGIREKRTRYKNDNGVYGLWVDDRNLPQNDFVNGKHFVIANRESFVQDMATAPYEVFDTSRYKLEYARRYGAFVNPREGGNNHTYGLVHGNLYDITARINTAPEIPEEEEEIIIDLEYKVTNWVGKSVNLPVFE